MPDIFDRVATGDDVFDRVSPGEDVFDRVARGEDVFDRVAGDEGVWEQTKLVGSALVTGIKRAGRDIDVIAEARKDVPTTGQQRRALEAAMADPRRLGTWNPATGLMDDDRQQRLFGVPGKLEQVRRPIQTGREARRFDIAVQTEELAGRPKSQTMRRWEAIPDDDYWSMFKALATDPVEIIATISAESLPASLVGLPLGPVGIGAASGYSEYASTLVSEAEKMGYDFKDPEQIGRFFQNPQAFDQASDVASKRAQVIGVMDAVSARAAGTILRRTFGRGASRVLGAGAAEVGMQMAGGAGGEALGSVLAGQPVSVKDVISEAIGELGGAPSETVQNLREDLRERTKERRRQLVDSIRREPPPPAADSDLVIDQDLNPSLQAGAVEGQATGEARDRWIDETDWSQVGVMPIEEMAPDEEVPRWLDRRTRMRSVRARAAEYGIVDPDVRWAPDLKDPNGQMIEAWVDPETGRAVFNAAASGLHVDERAGPIFREERAHQLLRSANGTAMVRRFALERMTPDDVRVLEASGYGRQAGWSDERHQTWLANEFIAKSAREQAPWWRDLVERVKVIISDISGGRVKLTNEEAARAILRSLRSEERAAARQAAVEPTAQTVAQGVQEAAPGAPQFSIEGFDEDWLRRAIGDTTQNLQAALNRRPETGVAKNKAARFSDASGRPLWIGADTTEGGKPFKAWVEEMDAWLSPDEIARARRWYDELHDRFVATYGEKDARRQMIAWLSAQQNVSPIGALQNVARVEDRLAGLTHGKRGGLADQKIEAVLTKTLSSEGYGPKLSDFVDAGFRKEQRSYVGNDPRGGRPFVADVHTGRDSGHVDQQTLSRLVDMAKDGNLLVDGNPVTARILKSKLVKEGGETVRVPESIRLNWPGGGMTVNRDMTGSPQGGKYEGISNWGNRLTDYLNQTGYQGGNWTPAQAQAAGWMRILRQYGLRESTVDEAIEANTHRVSAEVNYSMGRLLPAHYPRFDALPPSAQAAITGEVLTRTVNDLADIVGGSLRVVGIEISQGYWMGEKSPAIQAFVMGSPEAADIMRAALGLVTEQAGTIRVTFGKGGEASRAVIVRHADGNRLSEAEMDSLVRYAKEQGKEQLIPGYSSFPKPGQDGHVIAGLTGTKAAKLVDLIKEWGSTLPPEIHIDYVNLPAETDLKSNDWARETNGESYRAEIERRGGGSRIRRILDYRRAYAGLLEDAIARHAPETLDPTGREQRIHAVGRQEAGVGPTALAPPPAPPSGAPVQFSIAPGTPPGPPEERRFSRQVEESADVSNAVRAGLTNRLYNPRRNEPDAAFAQRIVSEAGGPEAAIDAFRNRTNDLPDAVRGFLAQNIVKGLGAAEQSAALTNPAESQRLAERAARFLDEDVFPATTSAGQFIQSFAAFSALTPQGMLSTYRRVIDRAGDTVRRRLQPALDRISRDLQKVNSDGLKELASDPAAQRATTAAANEAIQESPSVRNAITVRVAKAFGNSSTVMNDVRKLVRRALAKVDHGKTPLPLWEQYRRAAATQLARQPKGARSPGMLDSFVRRAVETLRSQIEQAMPPGKSGGPPPRFAAIGKLVEAFTNREKYGQVWESALAKLKEEFPNDPRVDRLAAAPAALVSPRVMRQALEEELAKGDVGLAELIANGYQVNTGRVLKDRIREALDTAGVPLEDADAADLARVADAEWKRLVEKERASVASRTRTVRDRESRAIRAATSGLVDVENLPVDELDAAIRDELRRLRTNLGAVLREHYSGWERTGETLAQRLADRAGLPKATADRLATQLQERFRTLLSESRRKAIMAHAASLPRKYRRKLPIDEIAELANLGLLERKEVWDAVRTKLGLPGYSKATSAEVVRRANELQSKPEGFQRDEAALDLLNYIARQSGVSPWELGMAFWYANTLSGPFTHLINAGANAQQIAAHSVFAGTRDPKAIPGLIGALADGFMGGLNEAGRVLRTGKVTGSRALQLEAGSPLELMGNEAWWQKILNKWKYVARALAASDMLFFKTAEAQRQYVLARAVAREEGLGGEELEKRTAELLHGTEEQQAQIKDQVEREGLSGTARDKRRRELRARLLPPGVAENAKEFGLRTIFNGEPYGLLGTVARWLKPMLAESPALRLVVPFVDVVANVTNEALNYFPPVGAGRALAGRYAGTLNGKTLDLGTESGRADLFDQQAKAAVGLVAMAGIAAAAAPGLDDEDPKFAIYGSGPGDQTAKANWRAAGGRPWTIKVGDRSWSYADSPLAIGLAVLGSYMDNIRWRKMEDATALDRAAVALTAWPRVIVQRSFLRGVSDLFAAISRDTAPKKAGERAVSGLATTGSSFVVPNLLRQVDRLFDPTVTDSSTVKGALIGQIPFVRRLGRPALTPLGDPVEASPVDRITSVESTDPLLRTLAAKEAWVSMPSQGELTADEHYQLVQERGKLLRRALEGQVAFLERATPKQAEAIVDRVSSEATKAVRLRILAARRMK